MLGALFAGIAAALKVSDYVSEECRNIDKLNGPNAPGRDEFYSVNGHKYLNGIRITPRAVIGDVHYYDRKRLYRKQSDISFNKEKAIFEKRAQENREKAIRNGDRFYSATVMYRIDQLHYALDMVWYDLEKEEYYGTEGETIDNVRHYYYRKYSMMAHRYYDTRTEITYEELLERGYTDSFILDREGDYVHKIPIRIYG